METQSGVIQYFVFLVFCHLLFSWVDFRSSNEKIAFWEFNQTAFLNLLVSLFLAHLLYGGISIALIALNMLFEAGFKDKKTGGQRYAFIYELIKRLEAKHKNANDLCYLYFNI